MTEVKKYQWSLYPPFSASFYPTNVRHCEHAPGVEGYWKTNKVSFQSFNVKKNILDESQKHFSALILTTFDC